MPFPPPIVFLIVQVLAFVVPHWMIEELGGAVVPVYLAAQIGWVLAVMKRTDNLAGRKPRLFSMFSSFGRTFWLVSVVVGSGVYVWWPVVASQDLAGTSTVTDIGGPQIALWGLAIFILLVTLDLCGRDFCEVEFASTQIKRSRILTAICFCVPIWGALYIHYRLLGIRPLASGAVPGDSEVDGKHPPPKPQ